jgi:N-acetyl-beta-hexosaminidase
VLTRERTNVTVLNPDGGEFVLYFTNPNDNSIWQSGKLYTNVSSAAFRDAVSSYYWNTWRASISVIKTMYDVNGTATND